MNSESTLSVDDHKFTILDYNLDFNRSPGWDAQGKPSDPGHCLLHLVIDTPDGLELYEWAAKSVAKDGRLVIKHKTTGQLLRKLMFTNAYCTNYREQGRPQPEGGLLMTTSFTLIAETIGSRGFSFKNDMDKLTTNY